MVLFLLHNTIGAWWAARCKAEGRIPKAEWDQCQSEDDCRKLVALPGLSWEYLRFVRNEAGEWMPAAGAFPGWPKALKLFRLLDPCCGSGHIIIAAFEILVRLRIQDEKLSAQDACDAVLRENLHGLELDQRCTQIAAFALALTAWKFTGGFRPLPPLNIACSGLGVNAPKEDWLALASGDTRLRSGLEQLYDLFQKAPELGSLIDPRQLAHGDLLTASFAEIQPLLTKALQSEKAKKNDDLNEIGVAAQGMAQAAKLLGDYYGLVVTNVPYLGRGKQDDLMMDYCQRVHPQAKADLATCFVERALGFCASGGSVALVTPQNWLFLTGYSGLRETLLESFRWITLARLGDQAFETISGGVVRVVLLTLSNDRPTAADAFVGLDASAGVTPSEKAASLRKGSLIGVSQKPQLGNPDARVTFAAPSGEKLLSDYAESLHGQGCFDSSCFAFCFWELPALLEGWVLQQTSPTGLGHYTGCSAVLRWENGEGMIARLMSDKAREGYTTGKWRAGVQIWGRKGVVVSLMRRIVSGLYCGWSFDDNVAVVAALDDANHLPIFAFCESGQLELAVRAIDQKLNVPCNTLAKVPFDLAHWQRVAAEKYPDGLPPPSSSDPTQWLFVGHPGSSTAPLHVGVARLLGYRWPRQHGQIVSGAAPVPPEDGLEKFVDEDGIVCIPSVRGEQPAADRLRELLIKAYGKTWSPARQDELLAAVGFEGRTLEDWLRNGFFEQHSKFFHHRPFIWQVWDGRKDGFSALVNYHKLDHKLLEKLAYTYLGEWIKKHPKTPKPQTTN